MNGEQRMVQILNRQTRVRGFKITRSAATHLHRGMTSWQAADTAPGMNSKIIAIFCRLVNWILRCVRQPPRHERRKVLRRQYQRNIFAGNDLIGEGPAAWFEAGRSFRATDRRN